MHLTLFKQGLRLAKAQRLRAPADYRRVYQSKQWGGTALYSFNVFPLSQSSVSLSGVDATRTDSRSASSRSANTRSGNNSVIGVTVSKKVSKSAVVRNRIKRQIKEFYRLHQDQLHNAELVITAKPACAKAQDLDRHKSLAELWSKVLKWQRWRQRTESLAKT